MAGYSEIPLDRFRVQGNRLELTERFDPRYQPRAGAEMMDILASLAQECSDEEVVIDLSRAASMPSMMLGFLQEAKAMANQAGKRLKVRIKSDTYRRLDKLGVMSGFAPVGDAESSESLDLMAGE